VVQYITCQLTDLIYDGGLTDVMHIQWDRAQFKSCSPHS